MPWVDRNTDPCPHCPPPNLGLFGDGQVRTCKGCREALGRPGDRGKGGCSCSAVGRLPRGGIGMAMSDPEGQPAWQSSWPGFGAHPLSQPPLRPASSLLSERQRSVHPEARPSWPHRQGAVYSDPPFLPLQPLTRPMEQLQRGTPWSPAPSPPHLPGWVGSRGRTAAHAGREGAPGRRGLFERKLVKGARAESPNTPMPVLSSHQPTAGGRQGHSRRRGPERAFSRTGLGQAAA